MSADWNYAQLAKAASQYGGPQQYLDLLKAGAKAEGRVQGALLTAAAGGACLAATKGYDYVRNRMQLSEIAERELLAGMERASEGETPDVDDNPSH